MPSKNKATKTQRELAKEELQRSRWAAILGVPSLMAAKGAVSGAIGFGLINSSTPERIPTAQTVTNSMQAQAIGAAILSPATASILAGIVYLNMRAWEMSGRSKYDLNGFALITLPLIFLNSSFALFEAGIGASILGLDTIKTDRENGFSSSVNFFGGSLTGLLIVGSLILLRLAYLTQVVLNSAPQRSLHHSQPLMITQFSSAKKESSADTKVSIQNVKDEEIQAQTKETASSGQRLSLA